MTKDKTDDTTARSALALFYERRLVEEIDVWSAESDQIRLSQALGLLPGMVVELALDVHGERTSGVVGVDDDGEVYITLEGTLF